MENFCQQVPKPLGSYTRIFTAFQISIKLLNFLSSLKEMRSLNFNALDSITEQMWKKSSGHKKA